MMILLLAVAIVFCFQGTLRSDSIDVGNRLELFTDDFIIERLSGDARQVLRKPEPKEVVLTTDAPWEGNTCGYYTVFQDGHKYRMYYRGSAADPVTKKPLGPMTVNADGVWVREDTATTPQTSRMEVTCVAESEDGIHWARPNVNLFEWAGSRTNNIVWMGALSHNMAVFKDGNPDAPPEARYKAIARSGAPRALQSPDGLRWKLMSDEPLVTDGTFDSQNIAFWDSVRQEYRLYWRINPKSVRGIRTATSRDILKWGTDHHDLVYPGAPEAVEWKDEIQMYTSAVQPYFRAPHLFVGFPTRLIHKGQRVEPMLMTSRDGVHFTRWLEAVIPPTAPADREGNRSNYMAWGMVQLPGKPDEISVYATEAYYGTSPSRLRRFTYRVDGFVSVSANAEGGELLTKPLQYSGATLSLNYAARSGGTVQVELQDADGKAIPGFTLADSDSLSGDSIEATASWKGRSDIRSLASRHPIRVRFVLKDADLYSMRF